MIGILLIFLYLAIGIILKKWKLLPQNFHLRLNAFVLMVALPATILYYIPQVTLNAELLYPVAVAWIIYLLAWLIFSLLQKPLHWDKATVACLTLCCGLGNTSFIGYPVIKALYGETGLKTAILVDQPGSFVVLSTLGIFTAMLYSSGKASAKAIGQKLFSFPPFIAFLVAVVLLAACIQMPQLVNKGLWLLAQTLVPVALISVGLQLDFSEKITEYRELMMGLGYKLMLAPLIIVLIFLFFFRTDALSASVSVMEAAMAPMITGAILAGQYNLRPRLANAFISIGIPLSFITLAIWWLVLRFMFS
jgi:predicted permease